MSREILLFVEDYAHQEFIEALLHRLAQQNGLPIGIRRRSVWGGHGRVLEQLRQFLRDVRREHSSLPDLIVVGTDANCKGAQRRRDVEGACEGYPGRVIHAIPDPHIERWLLLDSAAFKSVLGTGCNAPDHKCERLRYKQLLGQAVRAAGVQPILGGLEYATDIVNA